MRLLKGIIETPLTRPGMTIREAVGICVDKGVQGLPFVDSNGRITGRFSVRNTLLLHCIPGDMVHGAHLIGHEALHLEHSSDHYRAMFDMAIDPTIITEYIHLSSGAQITKALALMEKFNTSYLFVIDDGRYLGVVTRLGLARLLLDDPE